MVTLQRITGGIDYMEPISRIEKFLAKAAGDAVEIPKPMSRIEKYLNKIAEAGGGGGGGDSSVLVVHNVDGTLDKTWQEIYDAFVSGKVVFMLVGNGGNYFFAIATNIIEDDGESYYVYFSFVDGEVFSDGFATTTATGYPTFIV